MNRQSFIPMLAALTLVLAAWPPAPAAHWPDRRSGAWATADEVLDLADLLGEVVLAVRHHQGQAQLLGFCG